MNSKRLMKAKQLAARPYQMRVFADLTTDGEPGYYAMIPELPGCVSDGDTVEEARQNVESAKVDFIYFLLEDGLDVPKPQLMATPVRINMLEYLGVDSVLAHQEGFEGARIVSA